MDDSLKRIHNIILEGRNKLSISGVIDMESFDEEMVVISTEMGLLEVKGENLHINKLSIDNGEINLDGNIISISYACGAPVQKQGSLFGRMFR